MATDPPRPMTGAPSDPDPQESLDISRLKRLLRDRRGPLSIRQAAVEAGVSYSTFSRVEAGSHPDLATFSALCAWLRVPASSFFATVSARDVSPLETALTHLRQDPRLTSEAAQKIGIVLTDLYEVLASRAAPQPVVACHLRASAVMRPGVPGRLASALRDMHDELERRVDAGSV